MNQDQKEFLQNLLAYLDSEESKARDRGNRGKAIEFYHIKKGIANNFGVVKHSDNVPAPIELSN